MQFTVDLVDRDILQWPGPTPRGEGATGPTPGKIAPLCREQLSSSAEGLHPRIPASGVGAFQALHHPTSVRDGTVLS